MLDGVCTTKLTFCVKIKKKIKDASLGRPSASLAPLQIKGFVLILKMRLFYPFSNTVFALLLTTIPDCPTLKLKLGKSLA